MHSYTAVSLLLQLCIVASSLTIQTEVKTASKAAATKPVPTISSPANLTYKELVYILQYRSGTVQKPVVVLSNCARAVLGCCNSGVMNQNCFESLRCGGLIFDDNPCEDKFIIEALKAAREYYDQWNDVST
ncbi:hypothetical protein EVAR_79116_1 [Eumeta japonica]|uniref:Uncharacterized protein n=1 Tax=Eumeta variegata TaxID=151549 RepID=A0A4C1X1M9_EUMVA|nr:hypothetical protein EVAR_79116_1 [Eumeta japonica]